MPAFGAVLGYTLGLWWSLLGNTILFFAESDKAAVRDAKSSTSSPSSRSKRHSEKRIKSKS